MLNVVNFASLKYREPMTHFNAPSEFLPGLTSNLSRSHSIAASGDKSLLLSPTRGAASEVDSDGILFLEGGSTAVINQDIQVLRK